LPDIIDLDLEESKYLEIISISSNDDEELEIISIPDSEYHHPNKNDLSDEHFLDGFEYISDHDMNEAALVSRVDNSNEEKLD
jgi:hypothetical protein